jgi:hypothetical protein
MASSTDSPRGPIKTHHVTSYRLLSPSRLPLASLSPGLGRQGGGIAPHWHQPKEGEAAASRHRRSRIAAIFNSRAGQLVDDADQATEARCRCPHVSRSLSSHSLCYYFYLIQGLTHMVYI